MVVRAVSSFHGSPCLSGEVMMSTLTSVFKTTHKVLSGGSGDSIVRENSISEE
jgi:hypothetical protein